MMRTPHDTKIDEAIIAASEREQRLIAEELHETICQNLCAISIQVQTLRRRAQTGENFDAAEIEQLGRNVEGLIEQTRSLARQLNPKDLQAEGLVRALQGLANLTSVTVPCHFEIDERATVFDPEQGRALYRVAQEAVRNALQHAGARCITLRLVQNQETVSLEVRDDGQGFKPGHRPGRIGGIEMMRQRIEAAGGTLRVEGAPGAGTVVRGTLPIRT